VDLPECGDCYLHDLLELRNGDLPSIDVTVMTGVIAFPSFHAVFAMMFTYAHRSSVTFPVVAVLNLLMLFSIPSEGGGPLPRRRHRWAHDWRRCDRRGAPVWRRASRLSRRRRRHEPRRRQAGAR
jgi:hypothetical protein